ncbi:glycosyltransferase [Ideonella sp.]|uniref:glycosyltransferase n=1 Tax=Ideonella sp. TaxID=1929293 RepID=UPI003BB7E7BD
MTIIFFNPYADTQVKGAARRIEFLRDLLNGMEVASRAILKADYPAVSKGWAESLAWRGGLRRLAYFLQARRLCLQDGQVVISEVIFTPTWHSNMVLTVHDLKAFEPQATRGGMARKWAYLVFARLARRVVVVSESVRADMIRCCGVRPERIHVLPNGISQDRLALARQSLPLAIHYDFVYVSSFARHKRHALLLRAAPIGSRICLIGRELGALEEARQAAAERQGEVEVHFRHDVDTDEQLFELLGASRCGVFPSIFEGFGIPLLEYAAAGLHVIATDIPPFAELSQYVDRFVPADDEPALRSAMQALLTEAPDKNPESARRVAQGPYTESAIASKLAELLRLPRPPSGGASAPELTKARP